MSPTVGSHARLREEVPGAAPVVTGVFDAPSGSEWSTFWSTPGPARVYNAAVVCLAVAVTVGAGFLAPVGRGALATLAGLVAGGMLTVELGRLAEGSRVDHQRIHKGLSAWPFAGALLLGPGLAGWIAVSVYVHAWARGVRITLWKWVGSCAIVILAALAASATMEATTGGRLGRTGSIGMLAGVFAALAAFLAVESALFFVVSRLNSPADEIYLRAQLANPAFYLIEFAVLASGALAAVLFRYEAGFLVLAVPVYVLVQRGLLHEPLQDQAHHDAKTGLLNSEAWRAAAEGAMGQARREGRPAAVLIVDIDHFKAVNDNFGHLAGDDVLTRTAAAIVQCVRQTDAVGRFGGDEFCALLTCDTVERAVAAAERICSQIACLDFAEPAVRVTASVGVAVMGPTDVRAGLSELVAAADRALYQAKTGGRDQVCVRAA